MKEFIYNSPEIIYIEEPIIIQKSIEISGVYFESYIFKMQLKKNVNVELTNITENVRSSLKFSLGEQIASMENPILTLWGLSDVAIKLHGDLEDERFSRFKTFDLTSEDIWNMPLTLYRIKETHDLTLHNLKNQDLAQYIHDFTMKYMIDSKL